MMLVVATAAHAGVDLQLDQEPRSGHFELSVSPVTAQVNGKFTQHFGTFAAFTWRLRDRFALQVLGGVNWFNEESSFNQELVDKFRVEAQFSSSLLWTWGLFGGTEVEPLVGELRMFDQPARLGVVLSIGLGGGGTRHQLKQRSATPATWADTGVRFMATAAGGLRLQLGNHFVARLEVRDVGYSAAVTTLNGCRVADVSTQCRVFAGPDAAIARNLLALSSSDTLHVVSVALAAGVAF